MDNPYLPPTANITGSSAHAGQITTTMIEALRKTKGWVILIGVLCFIGAAFCLLATLGMGAMSAFSGSVPGAKMPVAMIIGMVVFYLVLTAVYGFLGVYLVKYANAIGRLMKDSSTDSMEVALESQQKFWRLAGIMALLMVVMFVLMMAAAILVPAMMAIKAT